MPKKEGAKTGEQIRSTDVICTAIRNSQGFLSVAAESMNVSLRSVQRWVVEIPEVASALADTKEKLIDVVEAALLTKIKKGDTACTIFFLKTQAKRRGYVERVETRDVTDDLSDTDLIRTAKELLESLGQETEGESD